MKAPGFLLATAAVLALTAMAPAKAEHAWRVTSLLEFDSSTGYVPGAGVVADRLGTLYGSTSIGGGGPCTAGAGCGTVFALSRPRSAGGMWVFHKLYDFQGGQDGSSPSAPLTLAANGIVYGYTTGGTPGTVFRLLPPTMAGNPWTFQILYVFTGGADGNLEAVHSPLLLRNGELYGIASGGSSACGQIGCGSVFRLKPGAGGVAWAFEKLVGFAGGAGSGEPTSIVGSDESAALYVSTSSSHGAVLEISPPVYSAEWTERVVTRFEGGVGGRDPFNLLLASDGTLFGLALGQRTGLVFHLTRPATAASPWTRTTIARISDHRFGPISLAAGDGGSLIGAVEGDFDFFAGSVFQLSPPSTGSAWSYSEIWNFNRGPDRNPLNVIMGLGGNLFAVLEGGDSSNGSLVELRHP